jgi:2-C-methyl-D-erythritol 4-phosphate cytidylyltransferase
MPAPTAAAVVLAGGGGTRVGADRNKVYLPLGGRSVLARSLDLMAGTAGVGVVVLVVRPQDRDLADAVLGEVGVPVELAFGGATRQDSELAGLRLLAPRIRGGAVDAVLIHDGARPMASRALVAAVLAATREHGGAVPGLWRADLATVAEIAHDPADGAAGNGASGATHVERLAAPAPGLVAVQTPQGFRAGPLLAAYEAAAACGFVGTDTASCVARFTDLPVLRLAGEDRNIKITYAHDLEVADAVLARRSGQP